MVALAGKAQDLLKPLDAPGGPDLSQFTYASLRQPASDQRSVTLGEITVNLPAKITIPLESMADILRTDRQKGIAILEESVAVMNRSFPPEERTPAERFLQALDKGNYDILLVREQGKIMGALHQLILDTPEHGRVVAIPYIWVSDKTRGKGVGSQLCEVGKHSAQALGAWARIAEVNDKEAMTRRELRTDGGAKFVGAREKFWDRAGFEQLDMPYLQPQLRSHATPATYPALLLQIIGEPPKSEMVNHNRGALSIDRDAAISIVEAYHQEIMHKRTPDGKGDLKNDEAHQVLKRALLRGQDEISLIPLHRERSPFDREFGRYRMEFKYPKLA